MNVQAANPAARIYDGLAARYDDTFTRTIDRAEDRWVADHIRPHVNNRRVLDIGCGTGHFLDLPNIRPGDYCGIDASSGMILQASEHHPGADFWVGEAEDLDFLPKGSFDTAVCLWAFSYFTDQARALEQIRKRLRPGGTIVLLAMTARYISRRHHIAPATLLQPVSSRELMLLLHGAGYYIDTPILGFRHLNDPAILNLLPVPILTRLMDIATTRLPSHLAYTTFITARKPGA